VHKEGAPNFSLEPTKVWKGWKSLSLLRPEDLAMLERDAAALSPGISRADLQDIVHDALVQASGLVGDGNLVDAARGHLPGVLAERGSRARRGDALASGWTDGTGGDDAGALAPHRREQFRDPHTPKGLIRRNRQGGETQYLPLDVADAPSQSQRRMAARLVEDFLLPTVRGEPLLPEHAELLEKAYKGRFGHRIDHQWAEILVDELGKVVRGDLQARVGPNPDGKLKGDEGVIRLHRKPAALERDPNTPTELEVTVRRQLLHQSGNKALFGWVGRLFGEEQIILYESGTFVDPQSAASTTEPGPEQARIVLLNTIVRMSTVSGSAPVPAWVLDVELVEFLIQRRGFEGGGGRKKLTGKALVELLADRMVLADHIEEFGARNAERLEDETANRWADRCGALAQRIRGAID
jgi:hypothetical protein